MFSKRTSEQNTNIFNEQATAQGEGNLTLGGGVSITQLGGNRTSAGEDGGGAGQILNIDMSVGSKEVTLAALERMGTLTNQTVAGVLAGAQQVHQRSSELASNAVQSAQDIAQSATPLDPGQYALASQKQLLILGAVLAAAIFIKQKG